MNAELASIATTLYDARENKLLLNTKIETVVPVFHVKHQSWFFGVSLLELGIRLLG